MVIALSDALGAAAFASVAAAAVCVMFRSEYVARSGGVCSLPFLAFVGAPILIVAIALAGMRPESAGFDTTAYVHTYVHLGSPLNAVADGARYFGNSELLWWPLQSLMKPHLSASTWLLVNFLLVVMAAWLSYREIGGAYQISSTTFALAFATFFVVYAGNGMRQALSIPVGGIAVFAFFRRRTAVAFFAAVVAIGLHWSSAAILLSCIFRLSVFRTRIGYVLMPLGCLAMSSIIGGVAEGVTGLIGFSGFSDKYTLYFSGIESHVGQVWETANFWLVATISLGFLAVWPLKDGQSEALPAYACLYLSLVFFGVRVPDFSERYMPALLFVLPLMMALLISKLPVRNTVRSLLFVNFFIALGLVVYLNQSAQLTLGYLIE